MYCQRCGAVIPEGSESCPNCGIELGITPSELAPARPKLRWLPIGAGGDCRCPPILYYDVRVSRLDFNLDSIWDTHRLLYSRWTDCRGVGRAEGGRPRDMGRHCYR